MKTKWREIIAVVVALLLISLVITSFSAWDNDKPTDNQSWNTAMRDIRYNWDALEVELGINIAEAHPYYQSAAPTKKPDGTTSFDSDDLGRIWIDSDNNAIYVLTATTPTWTAVFISLANDTYFTAIDNAGTGTVNLIKATTGDIPEILVGAVLSADTAPAVDAGIANKKYVDDNATMVPAITGAGTGYAGEESVTLPNGLIIKFGDDGKASGDTNYTETITFSTPFPNSCLSAVASARARADSSNGAFTHELTAGSFKITNDDYGKCHWIAIGY